MDKSDDLTKDWENLNIWMAEIEDASQKQYGNRMRNELEWLKLRNKKLNYYGKEASYRGERKDVSDNFKTDFERTVILHVENKSDKKQTVYLLGTPVDKTNHESISIENCDINGITYENILNEINLKTYGDVKNIDVVVHRGNWDWMLYIDVYTDGNKKDRVLFDTFIDPFRRPQNTIYSPNNFEFKTQNGSFLEFIMPPKSYWEITYSSYPATESKLA